MAIVRWMDPFRDVMGIQDRMNRIFEEFLTHGRGREEGLEAGGWMPAVDIYETEDDIVVKAELPGVEKDHIGVEVKGGVLTLRGERKHEKEVKEESYHRVERSYGTFLRSFTLPSSVEEDKVSAKLSGGVLEIHLPKRAEAKPKQVRIAA
ncbi:MAG: Hsp20/alpha crystallin family protein [Deltaproteobacteria bacterium]